MHSLTVGRNKIALTLILMILSAAAFSQERQDLKVGYFVYPPHVFYSAEKEMPYGPLISFFTENFAGKMNVNIVWQKMTNKRSEVSLKQCTIDMFLLKGWSEERTARMLYPEQPFHRVIPSLLVNKDFPLMRFVALKICLIKWLAGRTGYLHHY